jgi:mono/diheme cytochrome c family protein
MFTGLLHSHRLFVILFLLHYVIKLVLLLTNRKEQLAAYTKKTRVPEMIISVGFLLTGMGMLFKGAQFTNLILLKVIAVFVSIPVAVIGFKKGNKALAALSVFLIVASYGLGEMNKKAKAGNEVDTTQVASSFEAGKLVYTQKCEACHGSDGKLGASGAKILGETEMTVAEQKQLILAGKNSMPPFRAALSDKQVDAVIEYIATFKP